LSQLGLIYLRAGRYETARGYYQQLVQLYPRDVAGRTALGVCLISLGKESEAETQLHTALRIDPNYDIARYFLARMKHLPHTEILKMK
jgi:Flp pilus assembly protein TadD